MYSYLLILNVLWGSTMAFDVRRSSDVIPELQSQIQESQCRGGFDIYFLLDISSSVGNVHFQKQTVDFVEEMIQRFTNGDVRVSFIVFSSEDRVATELALTADNDEIADGISKLRKIMTGGGTFLHPALDLAIEQMKSRGGDSASVIIAITDGRLDDRLSSEESATKARALGATILAVRIGQSEIRDLLKIADAPSREHIFRGNSFDDLKKIINKIVNTSCIEILAATPLEVCTGETFNVSIYGNGFTKTNDLGLVICNFRLNDTDNQEVSPYSINSTYLLCPAPQIEEHNSFVVLQVSVNGISFISSNVTITARDCEPPNMGGVVLGLFLILLLLGLGLLWWFWNILCCVVVTKPAKPPPPPPESPSKKKWPVVDASLYGGGGPGGMKPVTVRWGASGSTEAASHLEKARNAEVLAMIEEEDKPRPAAAKPGCAGTLMEKLALCIAPVKSLYDRVSIMRPGPGEKGRCFSIRRERL